MRSAHGVGLHPAGMVSPGSQGRRQRRSVWLAGLVAGGQLRGSIKPADAAASGAYPRTAIGGWRALLAMGTTDPTASGGRREASGKAASVSCSLGLLWSRRFDPSPPGRFWGGRGTGCESIALSRAIGGRVCQVRGRRRRGERRSILRRAGWRQRGARVCSADCVAGTCSVARQSKQSSHKP